MSNARGSDCSERSLCADLLFCPQDLTILTDRLSKINEALARKTQARNEYDRTIQETEAAYMKVLLSLSQYALVFGIAYVLCVCVCVNTMQILESSQTLLHVLKRETVQLTKKKQTSS